MIMARQRGFTLIELMAVIAIIAVAMVIVIINMGAMTPATRLTSSGRYVSAMIAQARDEAAISGYRIGIGYDLEQNAVWLDVPERLLIERESDEEDARVKMRRHALDEGVEIVSVQTDANSSVSSGELVLDFTPTGNGLAHIVHLRVESIDQDVWLEINPLTGEVGMTYSADDNFSDPPKFREITDDSFR